jgi:hypothetical protein
MRKLHLFQYFPPDGDVIQTRAYQMAKVWVQPGHKVAIIAESTNHPFDIIPPAYKDKFFKNGHLDGNEVIRV